MKERYYLKADYQTEWDEVSKEQFINAEQAAGFHSKFGPSHPATGGFSGRGMAGRIEYVTTEEQPMSDTLQEREDQMVIEDCKVCGYLPHMPWCDDYKEPTVPCSICSTSTGMLGTKLCDRCWELKTRIENDPDIARRILTATTGKHQPAAQRREWGGNRSW